MTGPVAQIRAAVDAGARTTAEIAGRTGLPDTLVSAVLQHFHRSAACTSTSCRGCPVQARCGGPVLLTPAPTWNNVQK